MKRIPTLAFNILAALISVLSEGCHCSVNIGTKKQPKSAPPKATPEKKRVNRIRVDLPGRTATLITDEGIYFTGGNLFAQAAVGDKALRFTKEAIFWNNEEVVKFTEDMTQIEIGSSART